MPLVTTREMFKEAYDGGYAVGAFNVNNMEIIQGITEAAAIENPDIPIALHLDHGDSFELCKSCIDGGFTSVMIDASSKSFEDNIALTKQVVEYAHAHGVVVEASLARWPEVRMRLLWKLAVKAIHAPRRQRNL